MGLGARGPGTGIQIGRWRRLPTNHGLTPCHILILRVNLFPRTISHMPSTRPMRRTQQSTDQLVDLLDTWRTRKIVVVGDFMLDRYIYGDADRLSPDAPVPVLARKRTEQVGGGASNVCVDLAALKCKVRAVGVVGRDDAGRDLRQALRAAGCSTAGLVSDGSRPTTVKMNLVGLAQHRHPQKMFRLDEESSAPLDPGIAA